MSNPATQPQNIPGAIKPTQQRYDSSYIARHIHFDKPTEKTLALALEILSGEDRVSIGLLVRRAVQLYGESLQRNSEAYREAERAAVRKEGRRGSIGGVGGKKKVNA